MNQPWGLSGPQFLGVYAAALAVSVLLAVVVRALLRGAGRAPSQPVDVYSAAALAGGANRVVDTAVVALIEGGHLRADRSRKLTPCGGRPDEPLQRAVLAAFGQRKSATLREVRSFAGRTPEVRAVCDALVADGLLVPPRRRNQARLVALFPVAVMAVGVVRAVNGAQLHRPISLLVVFIVLSAPVALVLLGLDLSRTRAGQRALATTRERYSGAVGDAVGDSVGTSYPTTGALVPAAVLAVAALGATGIADQDLRSALYGSTSVSSGGDGGSSGSSCGGSSSCGGGGGCGG